MGNTRGTTHPLPIPLPEGEGEWVKIHSIDLVRTGRLELPRVTPLEPKSSASTSSATFAQHGRLSANPAPQDRRKKKGPVETGPWRLVGRPRLERGTY